MELSRRLFFISLGAADFVTYDQHKVFFKSDELPAEKTSLRGIVLPVKSLCVLSWYVPKPTSK